MKIRIIDFLKRLNTVWFILTFTSLNILMMVLISRILEIFNVPNYQIGEVPHDEGPIEMFFLAVILAPIIETLFHQLLSYWLLSKFNYFRKNSIWIILVLALSFATIHYMIYTFIMGTLYVSGCTLRNKRSPYWTVVPIHALINLFAVLGNHFFSRISITQTLILYEK